MGSRAKSAFILALVVAAGAILLTAGALPPLVGSHFGADHRANGAMTRDFYIAFMLVFAVAVPLLLAAAFAWLPRRLPGGINIPNRDYWLAPERREVALDYLARYGYGLGCLVALFVAGIHLLLIEANRTQPAQLPIGAFTILCSVFVLGMILCLGLLVRRFRRPDTK